MLLLHFVLSLLLKAKAWMDDLDNLVERKFAEWTSYRSPKKRSVRLVGPEGLEARITPANVDLWVAPAAGNFNVAANWSINGAPGLPANGDTLQFGGSVGGVNGTNISAVDNIFGLQPAAVNITSNYSQTITLNQPLLVNGSVSIDAASGATIAGTGQLSIKGQGPSFNWGSGTISAPVSFSQAGAGGTITINGSDVTLNNTLTNWGTINWSSANPVKGPGPNINLGGASANLVNQGTFNIQTASTEQINGQAGSLVRNAGTMQKTGVNQTKIVPDFSQSMGSLTVNSGTLAFQNGCSAAGSVVLN